MRFSIFGLPSRFFRLATEGYVTVATPIQAQAIPLLCEGRDVLGCAQTGTGKTAAFALPILHRLSAIPPARPSAAPRCLVLCPTRELASQIGESFRTYGKHFSLRHAVIFGGVGHVAAGLQPSAAASISSSPRPADCSI